MPHAARRDVIALPPNEARGSGFPRHARLVRTADFDAVYRTGKRRSSSHFTVFFRSNAMTASRFGFSIKKALGGAVVRNRMRRRMRHIVAGHRSEIAPGWDIVIHPKRTVECLPFPALTADLLRLLKKL
ncbi:MAG: hypothetical protein NVS9B4_11590 [Candidatus Acidiferrum sp.]